ncbi:putative large ATP-binding protein (plasmid) [Euzebya pacifica]|uniref:Putative large ATP-binding protein n=2 Tax=Euzebya pacifica TaxID=1608957 RepID=A0A346Y690_9ACTN|nr:putative large ATP-binding protein [Euzebya pacifica]
MAIDAYFKLHGAVERLRRSHQRIAVHAVLDLMSLDNDPRASRYRDSARDVATRRGTTTEIRERRFKEIRHDNDTRRARLIELLSARHMDGGSPERLLEATWSNGAGRAGWFTALDRVMIEVARERQVLHAAPWATRFNPETAHPSNAYPQEVRAYLDGIIERYSSLPGAWHAPDRIVAGHRRHVGRRFVRPITFGEERTEWDDWIGTLPGDTTGILVLGDPGYGKSTLTRWETASRAAESLREPIPPKGGVPVLVTCAALVEHLPSDGKGGLLGPALTALYNDHVDLDPTFHTWATSHPDLLCIVLDAFDEVERGWGKIEGALAKETGLGRIIVTSRPVGRPDRFAATSGTTTVNLAPLTAEQAAGMISDWFAKPIRTDANGQARTATPDEDALDGSRARARDRLLMALDAEPQLASLTRIPLFAVLACTIVDPARAGDTTHPGFPFHREMPVGWVPRNRTELLWAAVIDRLYGVGIDGGYNAPRADLLDRLLRDAAAIAFHISIGNKGRNDPRRNRRLLDHHLRTTLGDRIADTAGLLLLKVGDDGGSGLLTENRESIDWLHKQVGEYLTAHHLAANPDLRNGTGIQDLIDSPDQTEVVRLLIGELARLRDSSFEELIERIADGHDLGMMHSRLLWRALGELPAPLADDLRHRYARTYIRRLEDARTFNPDKSDQNQIIRELADVAEAVGATETVRPWTAERQPHRIREEGQLLLDPQVTVVDWLRTTAPTNFDTANPNDIATVIDVVKAYRKLRADGQWDDTNAVATELAAMGIDPWLVWTG